MIVLYTPRYFETSALYCAREFKGMEHLERKRLQTLGISAATDSFIIPIVVRGSDELPGDIRSRFHKDFSSFSLTDPDMRLHPQYSQDIRTIAQAIYKRLRSLQDLSPDPCLDCSNFKLPSDEDVKPWVVQVRAASQPFPGR